MRRWRSIPGMGAITSRTSRRCASAWAGADPRKLAGVLTLHLLVLELLFPAEHARLVSRLFRLGNHSFALVGARDAGVGKDVVGIDFEDAPRGGDAVVEIFLRITGLGQAVQGIGKPGVELEGLLVGGDGFGEF